MGLFTSRKPQVMTERDALVNFYEMHSTATLVASIVNIEGQMDADSRLHRAIIGDVLCSRHPAVDQRMRRCYQDTSPDGIDFRTRHTYTEALLAFLSAEGVIR